MRTASALARGFHVAECKEPFIAIIFATKALGRELRTAHGRPGMRIRRVPIIVGRTYIEYHGNDEWSCWIDGTGPGPILRELTPAFP
jgi:hypothetical protein